MKIVKLDHPAYTDPGAVHEYPSPIGTCSAVQVSRTLH